MWERKKTGTEYIVDDETTEGDKRQAFSHVKETIGDDNGFLSLFLFPSYFFPFPFSFSFLFLFLSLFLFLVLFLIIYEYSTFLQADWVEAEVE